VRAVFQTIHHFVALVPLLIGGGRGQMTKMLEFPFTVYVHDIPLSITSWKISGM
jgi:hypothetical protein